MIIINVFCFVLFCFAYTYTVHCFTGTVPYTLTVLINDWFLFR